MEKRTEFNEKEAKELLFDRMSTHEGPDEEKVRVSVIEEATENDSSFRITNFDEIFNNLFNVLIASPLTNHTEYKVILEDFKVYMNMRKCCIKENLIKPNRDDAMSQMEKGSFTLTTISLLDILLEQKNQMKRKNELERKKMLKALDEKTELVKLI